MDVRTHWLLANKIYDELSLEKKMLIKKRNFLYGNVKPDMVSKYKLTRHYREESYESILNKINALSKIDWEDISSNKGFCGFSQDLGVVCHFICDFFCVPHNERWEFKDCMKIHMNYEKTLNKRAKEFTFNKNIHLTNISPNITIEEFLDAIYMSYLRDSSLDCYTKDLQYSYSICNIVLGAILQETLTSYKKSL